MPQVVVFPSLEVPVLAALIVVSLALAITLALLVFGRSSQDRLKQLDKALEETKRARAHAEAELVKKRGELTENKGQLASLKDELKQSKRKLFEAREGDKHDRGLAKERMQAELRASEALDQTRAELSDAYAEIQRLRGSLEQARKRGGRPQPALEAPAKEAPEVSTGTRAPAEDVESTSGIPSERAPSPEKTVAPEELQRLEKKVEAERQRARDAERELRRVKGRAETQRRLYLAQKGEVDLVRDKYKALERRLNRTLLESDLLRRAIVALEEKSGLSAERTELTSDEAADSDRRTDEAAAREEARLHEAASRAATASEAPSAAEAASTEAASTEAASTEAASTEAASTAAISSPDERAGKTTEASMSDGAEAGAQGEAPPPSASEETVRGATDAER